MNLGKLVTKAVKKYGDRTAIIFENKQLSYNALYDRVNRLANGLSRLGIKKGDRVLFLGDNSSQYIEADFALSKCGFIRVPLRSRLSPGELLHIMNDSEANTIILQEAYIKSLEVIKGDIKYVKNIITLSGRYDGMINYEELIADSPPDELDIDVVDDDIYALIYTTGTTGKPKGAAQSHKNQLWVTKSVLLDIARIEKDDVLLSFLPLMHAPIIFVMPFFISGAKHVVLPRFNAKDVLQAVEEEKVTTAFMVPTVIYMLLEYADLKNFDLSSLKTILYGGSPMAVEKLRQAMNIFGNVFVQAYGLAEAFMPITMLTKEDHINALKKKQYQVLGSAGKESTFEEIKIVDDFGKTVGINVPGEIIIRGDNVISGYWNKPDLTAEVIKEGWFYTGDIGAVDEDGFVYIVDRKHEMIITGGLNVYPRETEEVIYMHPAVLECVVLGVPHEKWGESVKGVVVLKKGVQAEEDDIINFCKGKIADYKIPKSIDFVDSLPKGGSEKILRKEIKEKYWKGYERKVH